MTAQIYVTGSDFARICIGPRIEQPEETGALAGGVATFARRAGATVEVKEGAWSWMVEIESGNVRELVRRIAGELRRLGVAVEME